LLCSRRARAHAPRRVLALLPQAEAAADRDVAALALASATSAKQVNYVLGAATTLSLAATVVLAFRGRPA
jgi:hypothetical protein